MKRNRDKWVGEFDFSNPAVLKWVFKDAFDSSTKAYQELTGMNEGFDMDLRRMSRRMETALKNVQYAREMVGEDYPDYPGTSYFEQDWSYINALLVPGYDAIERDYHLILAAAVWILDRLAEKYSLYFIEEEILPQLSEEEAESIPSICIGEDSVFSEEVLMKTVWVIMHRNDDCKVYKTKDAMERYILDEASVRGKNMQDVPSRRLFEKILSCMDPEEVEEAVRVFREKYWQLARAFFAGLAKNHAKRDQLLKSHDRLIEKIIALTEGRKSVRLELRNTVEPGKTDMNPGLERFKAAVELDRAVGRCNDQVIDYVEQKEEYTQLFHEYTDMTPQERESHFGADCVEKMKDFRIEDPYMMAFALICLADRGDDLIWMYYFGTMMARFTASALPWKYEYDELFVEDLLERHRDEQAVPLPDLYEKKYHDRDPENYDDLKNLSQLMFEMTGVILPRDFSQFDCLESYWNENEVPASEQMMMRICMGLSHAFTHRYPGTYADPEETAENESDAADLKMKISELQKQIASLSKENKLLKESAWKVQKQNEKLTEKLEAEHRSVKADRDELAKLREAIFLSRNQEEEIPSKEIELPYEMEDRIVICGGHDSFIKQFSQLITGNVRYLSNVRINEELIRGASSVWLQTNAMSHSDYYKIMDLCRRNSIPVNYFTFASARKCAEQIVLSYRK